MVASVNYDHGWYDLCRCFRKYQKLPEVVQACEDKKRSEFYKANRIRAQVFKKVRSAVVLAQNESVTHFR